MDCGAGRELLSVAELPGYSAGEGSEGAPKRGRGVEVRGDSGIGACEEREVPHGVCRYMCGFQIWRSGVPGACGAGNAVRVGKGDTWQARTGVRVNEVGQDDLPIRVRTPARGVHEVLLIVFVQEGEPSDGGAGAGSAAERSGQPAVGKPVGRIVAEK